MALIHPSMYIFLMYLHCSSSAVPDDREDSVMNNKMKKIGKMPDEFLNIYNHAIV